MAKLLLISKETIVNSAAGKFHDPDVMRRLKQLQKNGHTICIISGHPTEAWVAKYKFLTPFQCNFSHSRQSGKYIPHLLQHLKKQGQHHTEDEILVLGASLVDFRMATNSLRPLLGAAWAPNIHANCRKYGMELKNADDLENAVALFDVSQPWYFDWTVGNVSFFSLSDGNTKNKVFKDEKEFADDMFQHLKKGQATYQREFILRFLACLAQTPLFKGAEYFAVVPSSTSANTGDEVMYDYLDQARFFFTKRHHTHPILLRHTHSLARKGLPRNAKGDPANQIETLQLNPKYRGKLEGAKVVLLDDYMTRGVSLSVPIGLLRAAGAEEIICVTMGKFGSDFEFTDISFDPKDIYSKKAGKSASVGKSRRESGNHNPTAHKEFITKFASLL